MADQLALIKALVQRLDELGVAYDINTHRDALPPLRLWGGATVDLADMAALLPWIEWAYGAVRAADAEAA
ncbi:MAG: hypothetical protein R3F55_09145 [Alphaproteobacteria bacterium]